VAPGELWTRLLGRTADTVIRKEQLQSKIGTGQPEKTVRIVQDKNQRTGRPEHDSKDRTSRTGHPGWNNRGKIAGRGDLGHNRQDRKTGTDQPERSA
jgi:hypothetical protein